MGGISDGLSGDSQSTPVPTRLPHTHIPARRPPLDLWPFIAALLALIPLLTITRGGFPLTADGQVHLLRTLEVSRLLRAGVLYPRWAPDFYLGYGYPFFNFYAPGAHVLAALLGLAGLGVTGGVLATQVLALLLYPVGAFLAARALFSAGAPGRSAALAALVSAALYLYAPFRFRELFIQGNLSQLVALGWLPWCAWLLTVAARRASWAWAATAGAALAALVYAHHPSAFLAFPFLAAYATSLAIIFRSGTGPHALRRHVLPVFAAFLAGAALSAPFWLPAIAEMRDVNMRALGAGMFDARLNLVPLGELLSPAVILDDAALNPTPPNSLGLAQIMLAAAGIGAGLLMMFARRFQDAGDHGEHRQVPEIPASLRVHPRPTSRLGAALLVVGAFLAICLALMLPSTAAVWEALPLARFIAFPWRLLGPALLWAALLGGAVLLLLPGRWQVVACVAAMCLIPLSVAPYLFPRPFAPATEPSVGHTPAPASAGASVARYEVSGGAKGTASANEYLPRWVEDPKPPTRFVASLLSGEEPDRLNRETLPPGSSVEWTRSSPLEDAYRITLPQETAVSIGRFFFPGWRAWVNGGPVSIRPAPPYGLMEVVVPAGNHELIISFGDTAPRTAGWWLALGGLAGAAWMLRRGWRERNEAAPPREAQAMGGSGGRAMLAVAATIVLLGGVKACLVEPHTRWFRRLSPVEAPATMQHPLHTRFANGMELIGYDQLTETVRQGGELAVRLYWRAVTAQKVAVHPFVHLDAPAGDTTWANETKVHSGDKPVTGWPGDFYVIDEYRIAIPSDTPPILATLRAGLIDEQGELVPLESGADVATLGPVRVTEQRPRSIAALPGHEQPYRLGTDIELVGYSVDAGQDPSELIVTLYWRADKPIAADYTVFLHVPDPSRQVIAQADTPPMAGRYATSAWAPGQVIEDTHRVLLPGGVSPASLRVAVGLYNPADGSRLPVLDARGARQAEDQVLLSVSSR